MGAFRDMRIVGMMKPVEMLNGSAKSSFEGTVRFAADGVDTVGDMVRWMKRKRGPMIAIPMA